MNNAENQRSAERLQEVLSVLNGCIVEHHKNPDLFKKINDADDYNQAIDLFVSNAGTFPHLHYSNYLPRIDIYFKDEHFTKIIENIGKYEHPKGTLSAIIKSVMKNGSEEICADLWNKIEGEYNFDISDPNIINLATKVFGNKALSVILQKVADAKQVV